MDAPLAQPDSCPDCGKRRTAVCPICQTAGADFPPGEAPVVQEEADGEPPLLICPICDEPFEPNYLRRCEWCGHDFGRGVAQPNSRGVEAPEPPNLRVIAAAIALAALVFGALAYFASVLG